MIPQGTRITSVHPVECLSGQAGRVVPPSTGLSVCFDCDIQVRWWFLDPGCRAFPHRGRTRTTREQGNGPFRITKRPTNEEKYFQATVSRKGAVWPQTTGRAWRPCPARLSASAHGAQKGHDLHLRPPPVPTVTFQDTAPGNHFPSYPPAFREIGHRNLSLADGWCAMPKPGATSL